MAHSYAKREKIQGGLLTFCYQDIRGLALELFNSEAIDLLL